MRTLVFGLALLTIGLHSCKPKPAFGQTIIHIDTLLNSSITKSEAANSDSCILRFHNDFNNDTIWIVSPGASTKFIVASTNYSIAYATSCTLKKNIGSQVELKILQTTFSFAPLKDYLFIDIYYDKKAKRLDIYHSNNILILS